MTKPRTDRVLLMLAVSFTTSETDECSLPAKSTRFSFPYRTCKLCRLVFVNHSARVLSYWAPRQDMLTSMEDYSLSKRNGMMQGDQFWGAEHKKCNMASSWLRVFYFYQFFQASDRIELLNRSERVEMRTLEVPVWGSVVVQTTRSVKTLWDRDDSSFIAVLRTFLWAAPRCIRFKASASAQISRAFGPQCGASVERHTSPFPRKAQWPNGLKLMQGCRIGSPCMHQGLLHPGHVKKHAPTAVCLWCSSGTWSLVYVLGESNGGIPFKTSCSERFSTKGPFRWCSRMFSLALVSCANRSVISSL
jgi:hypothetical protein